MVKIVADALERESLFQELSHARRAKEEKAKDQIVFLRCIDQLVGRIPELVGEIHVGELVLSIKQTHGHAEIVLSEEEHIQSGDGGNLVDILDAICGFDL